MLQSYNMGKSAVVSVLPCQRGRFSLKVGAIEYLAT